MVKFIPAFAVAVVLAASTNAQAPPFDDPNIESMISQASQIASSIMADPAMPSMMSEMSSAFGHPTQVSSTSASVQTQASSALSSTNANPTASTTVTGTPGAATAAGSTVHPTVLGILAIAAAVCVGML
ncbi:hypothetical protein BC940DRAFT_312141 [Gongronella butleri]|nr:hypothetical protein BC940DRAFT_312141 [Gongronella butleri]